MVAKKKTATKSSSGLTAKQRAKLPIGLQKAIARKKRGKKK